MAEGRYIWDLLENGEYPALMAACPEEFVFRSDANPYSQCPALLRVVYHIGSSKILLRDGDKKIEDGLEMLQWLLDRGEDPAALTPRGCTFEKSIFFSQNKEETTLAFAARNHSAVSFALMMKRLMNVNIKKVGVEKAPWADCIANIDKILPLLYAACGRGRPAAREKIPIDAAIVHRWSKLLHDASSHDVTLQTDDGAVGGDVSILSLASPVLERMLSTTMVEGRTKRVAVRDTPKAAMELFLEIVYTGCVSAEEEDDEESGEGAAAGAAASSSAAESAAAAALAAAIGAHELAHRWNTDDVLALLENLLAKKLTDDNFGELAEAAHLRGTRALVDACVSYAARSAAVQAAADAGEYSAAVLELLGKAPAGEPSRKKRRLQSL